jgi:hypothetical protein
VILVRDRFVTNGSWLGAEAHFSNASPRFTAAEAHKPDGQTSPMTYVGYLKADQKPDVGCVT